MAARDEPELREVVRRGERAISEAIHTLAIDIFSEPVAHGSEFAEHWATALSTIRGLALLRLLNYPAEYVDDQWRTTRRHLLGLLSPYA